MKAWIDLQRSTDTSDRVLVAVIIRLSTTASYGRQTQQEIYDEIVRETLGPGDHNGKGNHNKGA